MSDAFSWVGWDMAKEEEWQPAVIASHEHVMKFHTRNPGAVTRYAGTKIRVRPTDLVSPQARAGMALVFGCHGPFFVVHPEDAERLWPFMATNTGICEHLIFTD